MRYEKHEALELLGNACREAFGTDAANAGDYVTALFLIKVASDRFATDTNACLTLPSGASFANMVACKGKADIGSRLNDVVAAIVRANPGFHQMIGVNFTDEKKLGSGAEMVDRLTRLISVFERVEFQENGELVLAGEHT